jgi:hypothetical protein
MMETFPAPFPLGYRRRYDLLGWPFFASGEWAGQTGLGAVRFTRWETDARCLDTLWAT